MQSNHLHPGDPAPWFVARSTGHAQYRFDTCAGRYVVLCFLGSAGDPLAAAALQVAVEEHRGLFDDANACLFGISTDTEDERLSRLTQSTGIRHIWDFDQAISRLYGAAENDDPSRYTPFWLVLDPMLRVLRMAPLDQAQAVMAFVAALPPSSSHAGAALPAPVLVLPRVFEPGFCEHLIGLYQAHGGEESGFMLEVDGRTTWKQDASFKRRRDHTIQHEPTRIAMRQRIERRLVPEI